MDEIRVRRVSRPEGSEPQSAPAVPRQMMSDFKTPPHVPTVEREQPVPTHEQPEAEPDPQVPKLEDNAEADIAADTEDDLKADEPTKTEESPKTASPSGKKPNILRRALGGYWHHKLWTLPLTLVALLGILAGVPFTRYAVAGAFISRPFTITVTDSTTGNPVTGASLKLDGQTKLTDSKGKATIPSHVGTRTLSVTKTYYQSANANVLVDIFPGHNALSLKLVATGRQVPVVVINKITGKPIPEAEFTVGSATARSDLKGMATLVVPAHDDTQAITIKADGYNDFSGDLKVTTSADPVNTFALVPAGKLYFLSNLSGKLDIVSTNLDGSERKTVLAGTGKEDKDNTLLLGARDWQYLMLLSKRDGGDHPKIFLINAATDKLTTVDEGANFSLIGWSGHNFVYQVNRDGYSAWQPGASSLKTYNADTNKSATIISTNATGSSNADATYETISQTSFLGTNLIYIKTWYRYPGYTGVSGQQNVLVSAKADGSGSKTLKSVDANQYYFTSLNLAKPDQLYFATYDVSSSNPNYYRVDANGNITQSSTITADAVNQTYPTYLLSPTGKATFWTEPRDGKNTLFVGDYEANGGTQIASLSDYAPYGWFSDDYLLVQKSKSELYILPASGGTPQKISDYFKPYYSIYGYGGGYGGL